MTVMRKSLVFLAVVLLASGCTTTKRDGAATYTPVATDSMSASATPIPSDIAPTSAPSAEAVGPATVSGAMGSEPVVTIDTAAAAVTKLLLSDIEVGTGATVGPNSTVTAHYAGYGATSGKQFDSSWLRGEPATFPLSGVILGWQQGLQGMQVGGRRVLVIPAKLGYGDTPPAGSGIQPGETLVFVVDLVDSK